jgi:hypothetical protein
LDTVTYPQPAVRDYIAAHFVPLRLVLNRAADQPHFRAQRVIWTPTIVILDRRGQGHYQSPGYLPPDLFLPMMRIGLARTLGAWGRYDEAAEQLTHVADEAGPYAPEALFWLGAVWYLQSRRRTALMRAWGRLRAEYPSSIWAARIPPNQEQEPDQ